EGDPQSQALRVTTGVAQCAPFPPCVALLPGHRVGPAPVEARRGAEQTKWRTGRGGRVERIVESGLGADGDPEPDAGTVQNARVGGGGERLFAFPKVPFALHAQHATAGREELGDVRAVARGPLRDTEAH